VLFFSILVSIPFLSLFPFFQPFPYNSLPFPFYLVLAYFSAYVSLTLPSCSQTIWKQKVQKKTAHKMKKNQQEGMRRIVFLL